MTRLEELLQTERANFRWGLVRPALAGLYVGIGGNLANAREIVQEAFDQLLAEELANVDLPGPDSYLVPRIREAVKPRVGALFDKLFATMGS